MTLSPGNLGSIVLSALISLLSILCLLIFIGLIGLYRAIFKTRTKKRQLLKVSATFITVGGLGFLCAGFACTLLLWDGVQNRNSQSMRMIMPPKTVSCLETPLEDPYILAIYQPSSGEASGSLFEKGSSEAVLKSISSYTILDHHFIGTFASHPQGYTSFWLDFKSGGHRQFWEKSIFNRSVQEFSINPATLSFQPVDAICKLQVCQPCKDTHSIQFLK